MKYIRPFITRRFIAYGGDSYEGISHVHNLSLAVNVIDAFTSRRVEAQLRVSLKELGRLRPFLSQSGLFCFEDIPDGQYTLVVEPNPVSADWFFWQPVAGEQWQQGFERQIKLPLRMNQPSLIWPRLDVTFSPKSTYPFPLNSTLVRGQLTEGAKDKPVESAVISTKYYQVDPHDNDRTVEIGINTLTDRSGEYALFFKRLPNNSQQIVVTAIKEGQQDQKPAKIVEGNTQMRPLHFL